MHELHRLLLRLSDAGMEFVVVGGYAGVIHGSAYITQDLDVCAALSAENIAKLAGALVDLAPVDRTTGERFTGSGNQKSNLLPASLRLKTDLGLLDVCPSVPGIGDFSCLKSRAVEVPLFGRKCAVISLEDLIAAKEAVGRERDLLTVKELRAIAAKRARPDQH